MDSIYWIDMKLVATCSRDKIIKIWQLQDSNALKLLSSIKIHTSYINSICFCIVNQQLILYSGDSEGNILISDPLAGNLIKYIKKAHSDNVCCLNRASGNRILSSSWDGHGKLWKFDEVEQEFMVSTLPCWDLMEYGPDFYLAACGDGTVKMIGLDGVCRVFSGHKCCVRKLVILGSNRDLFFSVGNDGLICCWNVQSGLVFAIQGHTSYIYSIFESCNYLVTVSEDCMAKLWKFENSNLHLAGFVSLCEDSIWDGIFFSDATILAGSSGKLWIIPSTSRFGTYCDGDQQLSESKLMFCLPKIFNAAPKGYTDNTSCLLKERSNACKVLFVQIYF